MDIILISDYVVVIASFITPIILLPQIIRLLKVKESNAISLLMLWGSLFLQTNIFINAYLHEQWQIMIAMAFVMSPLSVVIFLGHKYRR